MITPSSTVQRKAEIDAAIHRVLDSGRLDWGDEVPAFEEEFAALERRHACGHGRIRHGRPQDRPSGARHRTRRRGRDGSQYRHRELLGDPPRRRRRRLGRCRAREPNHGRRGIRGGDHAAHARGPPGRPLGHPANLKDIVAVARKHDLAVVEDACIALGATLDGTKVGTYADVTCFSFAPTKHLGAFGSGGACLTENAALAERLRLISGYGQARSRHRAINGDGISAGLHHETDGTNERLDELQAAVLRVKLKRPRRVACHPARSSRALRRSLGGNSGRDTGDGRQRRPCLAQLRRRGR